MLTEREIQAAVGGKPGTNYLQVTPAHRAKLKGLMAYYAKKPHPFTACVRDNTKRFGPERAKRVCAVLKDLIENRTTWRKGGKKKLSAAEEDLALETHLDQAIIAAEGDVEGLTLYLEQVVANS